MENSLHSHPIFIGLDDKRHVADDGGRFYYGVYLETNGAPIEIETMPG